MTMKLLISLISEQTIPNVLCIDYFKPDFLLMVSTKEMDEKKKINFIANGLKRISKDFDFSEENKNMHVINVNQESLVDVVTKIENWFTNINRQGKQFDEIIANITGGTKIMSLGLYNAVVSSDNIPAKKFKIVYMPIGNKIVDLSEKHNNTEDCKPPFCIKIKKRLSIVQYLESKGIQIIPPYDADKFNDGFTNSFKHIEHAKLSKDVSKFIMQNYCNLKNFLASIYSALENPKIDFNKNKSHIIDRTCNFLDDNHKTSIKLIKKLFNFHYLKHLTVTDSEGENKNLKINIKGEIAKHEYEFLKGGWLERFCFNELYELKKRKFFNDIAINVNVENKEKGKEAKNEFDILFTYNNNLYMVECKSLNQGHDPKTEILYKISALQEELGRLTTKSFLASTAENIMDKNNPDEIKKSLLERAGFLNCVIIKPSELINIKEQIKNELKINKDKLISGNER